MKEKGTAVSVFTFGYKIWPQLWLIRPDQSPFSISIFLPLVWLEIWILSSKPSCRHKKKRVVRDKSYKSVNSCHLHCGHQKALHSSVSVFYSTPPALLSTNSYCLIIAMCVSNCLVCFCDAPSNFNQALHNGALECVRPSLSAYHICPFTTRLRTEYKSEALHYWRVNEGRDGERGYNQTH